MKVVFRVDSSCIIGGGHLMRCVTLAQALIARGDDVEFICRAYPGNMIDLLKTKSFGVKILPFADNVAYQAQVFSHDYAKWLWVTQEQDAAETSAAIGRHEIDWLIVDHYGLDRVWHAAMRERVKKILVIDDLANRDYHCDMLLDQNYYHHYEERYQQRVLPTCRQLLGPSYALLHPQLINIREARQVLKKERKHPIHSILLFMGSADPDNVTEKILQQLIQLPSIEQKVVHVLVGIANKKQDEIKQFCQNFPFLNYHCQPDYYHELLTEADVAIVAGGTSVYERCFIQLPSIVLAISQNQIQLAEDIAAYGAHYYAGTDTTINFEKAFLAVVHHWESYHQKMQGLVDHLGTERMMEAMHEVAN